ncbi:glucose-6-phosphatase 2-like protein [Leptotrombidium deliense]|uniref:Glucose-6-phosphatase n=1 Tax=Leptotrombidium deliense TaxID=299467 RepID=A0A443SGH1_9ACAR|nr:glucose-6-phosphatase 2-like protein [Leptotrombidium deliense]
MAAIIRFIRIWECRFMQALQEIMGPIGPLCISGCHIGDPKIAQICFPLLMAISTPETAFKVLWAVTLSEWLNICLKLILNDHRPYWWVPEYVPKSNIKLNMFDITCESNPGNPSGHLMVTSCVWLVAYWHLCSNGILKHKILRRLSMTTIIVCLVIIGCGRLYVSAHFPDQIIAGVEIGVLLANFVDRNISMNELRTKHHMLMALLAVAIYHTIRYFVEMLSGDKDWTLKLALKWCSDPRNVKADTIPSFTVCRVFSSMVSIAFTFMFVHRKIIKGPNNEVVKANIFTKSAVGFTASLACYLFLNNFQPSTSLDALEWFYAFTFCLYFVNIVLGYSIVMFLSRVVLKYDKSGK